MVSKIALACASVASSTAFSPLLPAADVVHRPTCPVAQPDGRGPTVEDVLHVWSALPSAGFRKEDTEDWVRDPLFRGARHSAGNADAVASVGGVSSQQRWQKALGGLQVLWVGVRCERTVAAGREVARGDRVTGMAVSQAHVVHAGVFYDLEVDTTHAESMECARAIAAHVQ